MARLCATVQAVIVLPLNRLQAALSCTWGDILDSPGQTSILMSRSSMLLPHEGFSMLLQV